MKKILKFLLTIVFVIATKVLFCQMPVEKLYTVAEALEQPEVVGALKIDYTWKKSELPQAIFNCKNIEHVKIDASNTMDHPKIIQQLSQFPNLKNLEISFMESLPAGIDKLHNLESLKIILCKDEKVPEEFNKLTKLKRLDLFRNNFKTYPESLSKLVNLTYVSVADNGIEEVPAFIYGLGNLDSLDLSYNALSKLDNKIGNLSNLKYLNVCFNNLEELPEDIGNLKQLKHLKLGWNENLTFLEGIEGLVSLEVLDMSGCDNEPCNGLIEIPAEIGALKNLRHLDFGWCYVNFVPKELKKLKNLEYFRVIGEMHEEDLEQAKKMMSFVKVLKIENQ